MAQPSPENPAPPRLVAELAEPRRARGQVMDRTTRQGLEGAWVFVQGAGGLRVTRSDRGGYFELIRPAGAPGEPVMAFQAGFRLGFAIAVGESGEASIELEPAARVEGRVVDAAGRPVGGARILTSTAERARFFDFQSLAISRRDGFFAVSDLRLAASARLMAIAGWLPSPIVEIPLAPGAPASVELVLPEPVALRLRVEDPQGRKVAGAEVFGANPAEPALFRHLTTEPAFEGELSLLGVTDGEGLLHLEELAPGSYDFAARAAGFAPAIVRQVALSGVSGSGEEPEIELRLRPAGLAHGRVLDELGQGVAGAELFLTPVPDAPNHDRMVGGGPPAATSGAAGGFRIAGVDASRRFHLVATREGFVTGALRDAQIDPQQPLIVTLQRGGEVRGHLLTRDRPAGPAVVRLLPEGGDRGRDWEEAFGSPGSAPADPAGNFAFAGVRPGLYRLAVPGLIGFQPYTGEVFELRAGERREQDITLELAAVLTCKVLLPNGRPAVGAQVQLFDGDGPRGWRGAYTYDRSGGVLFGTAIPGPARLKVRHPGYRDLVREIEILPGENTVELTLEPGPIDLVARVVDRDGAGVAGVEALLDGDDREYQATGGDDGRVGFFGMEAGTYRLKLVKEGYFSEAGELTVEASRQDLEWPIRRAAARLEGTVSGLPGGACADLEVRAVRGAREATFPGRCADGIYSIENLPAGRFKVIVASAATGGSSGARSRSGKRKRKSGSTSTFAPSPAPGWAG